MDSSGGLDDEIWQDVGEDLERSTSSSHDSCCTSSSPTSSASSSSSSLRQQQQQLLLQSWHDSPPSFLLSSETILHSESNIVLINVACEGLLLLTNLRLLFVCGHSSPSHSCQQLPPPAGALGAAGTMNAADITDAVNAHGARSHLAAPSSLQPLPLGSLFFSLVERAAKIVRPEMASRMISATVASRYDAILTIHSKDARILSFAFPLRLQQLCHTYSLLLRLLPTSLASLPCFLLPTPSPPSPPPTASSSPGAHPSSAPRNSFKQALPSQHLSSHHPPSQHASSQHSSHRHPSLSPTYPSYACHDYRRILASLAPSARSLWRISAVNSKYSACSTYPSHLLLPSAVSDEEAIQSAAFRARGRFPAACWVHPENGASLSRSAQPLVGIVLNSRSDADERLVSALREASGGNDQHPNQRRQLVIADARPRKNAIANGAMGGGCEPAANYRGTEVVYLGLDNIHAVRDSMSRLRDFVDTHGAACSDGALSLLRSSNSVWSSGSASSATEAAAALSDSSWLHHQHLLLSGAAFIAAQISQRKASVLVHCSDGWDRTPSLVSLAMLLLDPFYRTFEGFKVLVETHWASFGHQFGDRFGVPSEASATEMMAAKSRNDACTKTSLGLSSSSRLSSNQGLPREQDGFGHPHHPQHPYRHHQHPHHCPHHHLHAHHNAHPPSRPSPSSSHHHHKQDSDPSLASSLPSLSPSANNLLPCASSASCSIPSLGNFSPVFFQWLDCVAHLLRLYPTAFEFTAWFLVDVLDAALSCRFTNFITNSERERMAAIASSGQVSCMWDHLARVRSAAEAHPHVNAAFDASCQHSGLLLPPAASLAPSMSPHFFLRWCCPKHHEEGGEGSVVATNSSPLVHEDVMMTSIHVLKKEVRLLSARSEQWEERAVRAEAALVMQSSKMRRLTQEAEEWRAEAERRLSMKAKLEREKGDLEVKMKQMMEVVSTLREAVGSERQKRFKLEAACRQSKQEAESLRSVLQADGCCGRKDKAKWNEGGRDETFELLEDEGCPDFDLIVKEDGTFWEGKKVQSMHAHEKKPPCTKSSSSWHGFLSQEREGGLRPSPSVPSMTPCSCRASLSGSDTNCNAIVGLEGDFASLQLTPIVDYFSIENHGESP